MRSTGFYTTTDSAGKVICVPSVTTFTGGFLQVPHGSNILWYISSLIDDDDCSGSERSPPLMLVQVSTLTATSTEYGKVSRSAKTQASPSIAPSSPTVEPTSITIEPLHTRSKSVPNLKSSLALVPSESPSTALPDSSNQSQDKSAPKSDAGSIVMTKEATPAVPSKTSLIESPITSRGNFKSQTSGLPSIVSNEPGSATPTFVITKLSKTLVSKYSSTKAAYLPDLTIGSEIHTFGSSSQLVIGSATIVPGGSAVTSSGTRVSLESSVQHAIVNGNTIELNNKPPVSKLKLIVESHTYTANSLSQLVIGDSTAVPGGPAITVSDATISIGPSSQPAVINGKTVALSNHIPISTPGLAAGSQIYTTKSPSHHGVEGTTAAPGGLAIIVSGSTISIEPSALNAATSKNPAGLSNINPFATSNIQISTASVPGAYLFKSQTLFPGSSPVTVSGTRVSLAPSMSALVIGSSTVPVRLANSQSLPVIVIGGSTFTPNYASQYPIGSQTLVPGTGRIIVSGVPISLAASESFIVVGTSTETPTTSKGLGAIIIQGLGGSNDKNTTQYTGSACHRKWEKRLGILAGFVILVLLEYT